MSSTIHRAVALLIALTVVASVASPALAQLGTALVRAQVVNETLRARRAIDLREEPRRAFVPFWWESPETGEQIDAGGEVTVVGLKETSEWGRTFLWLEVRPVRSNDSEEASRWIRLGPEPTALATVWNDWELLPDRPED